MRLELAGTLIHPEPLVIRYDVNDTFTSTPYRLVHDYTHFEVICIGGAGGMGGGINTGNTGTTLRSYGGAGGGGGYHRVRGLLSALPTLVQIIVGAGGVIGNEHSSDPNQTTDGGDGGYSSFNGTTCMASGGKGGKRVQTNSANPGVTTNADGGVGGIGNRTIAGGGADGGVSGSVPVKHSSAGIDGTIFNNIGKGGGGGAGGLGGWASLTAKYKASPGGRGSYNPGDTSVYCPASPVGNDPNSGTLYIVPGGAGGAKASPLNGLPTLFGYSYNDRLPGNKGVVILRLTSE